MRHKPDERRNQLINIAVECAKETDYRFVSCKDIADRAQCSPGLVIHYFDTVENLRDCMVRTALERRVLEIIAQAMTAGHPYTKAMHPWLKQATLAHIGGGV